MSRYLFTSERLGFREWQIDDVAAMAAINADPAVMAYFPSVQDLQQTTAFVARMQQQQSDNGYCYFAVETLADQALAGFIGLSDKTFAASFTPCIDIGWRLSRDMWGHGYATEGARRCLDYGLNDLRLKKIYAIAPKVNQRSVHVMRKIGMTKHEEFVHPQLADDERLRLCVAYVIEGKD